jgi:hypothetical protein
MGFLDWIIGKIECPRCGTGGAKEIGGQIHCPNPTCTYFSKTMGKAGSGSDSITFSQPASRDSDSLPGDSASLPAGSFAIRYRNFRGQERSFVAEAASARRNKNHVSVKVAPQGVRIALSRDRIQNLGEVEAAFPQRVDAGQDWPTPRERQVMTYHKKRRTTSPLYESIRAKYPNW